MLEDALIVGATKARLLDCGINGVLGVLSITWTSDSRGMPMLNVLEPGMNDDPLDRLELLKKEELTAVPLFVDVTLAVSGEETVACGSYTVLALVYPELLLLEMGNDMEPKERVARLLLVAAISVVVSKDADVAGGS